MSPSKTGGKSPLKMKIKENGNKKYTYYVLLYSQRIRNHVKKTEFEKQ
jgi:hypothetical protein